MMLLSSVVQNVGDYQEVVISAGSSSTLVDDIVGFDVRIVVLQHARVQYIKEVITTSDCAVHEKRQIFAHAYAEITASVNLFNVTKYQLDWHSHLCGVHAHITLTGGMIAKNGEAITITTHQQHAVSSSYSNVHLKGLARDNGTICYQGSISVPIGVPGCSAIQKTAFLTQGSGAVISAKPTMQVHTDAVTCEHASALGRISPDELLYLQARGLSHNQAETLLIQAFFAEVGFSW